jgi:aspartyl-tRNA(Asn)/glutamyl-tRNA(Gln) amidotransferase subunit A
MTHRELIYLTVAEASDLIKKKKLNPVTLLEAVLHQIEAVDDKVRAYVTVTAEEAMTAANAAERDIQKKRYRGPLHGIPVAVKDTHFTAGIRTTVATPILSEFVPDFDAEVIRKLKEAGAVLVGKLNLPEFSFGGETPGTHNPWDLSRTPGGSSGGSGAALAAGMALAATGGDTSGSIRGPASYCGIVGLKPTFGLVSRFGIAAISHSLDHVGPMTRTVKDNAIFLSVLAGHDPRDRSSADVSLPKYTKAIGKKVKGMKVAIPPETQLEGCHPDVLAAFHNAISIFGKLGIKIREHEIPFMKEAQAVQRVVRISEAASYHEAFLKHQANSYGTSSVRRDLELGSMITAVQYLRAQKIRVHITSAFERVFEAVDAFLTPAEAEPAGENKTAAYNFLSYFNLLGNPALALPCGFSTSPPGLPLGLQIVGHPFAESTIYALGDAYQRNTTWHQQRPQL